MQHTHIINRLLQLLLYLRVITIFFFNYSIRSCGKNSCALLDFAFSFCFPNIVWVLTMLPKWLGLQDLAHN